MTRQDANQTDWHPASGASNSTEVYDPLVRGRYAVGVRTIQVLDTVRGRSFPCEIRYPAAEAARLSEGALKDWRRPEEDAAWSHLQSAK